MPDNKNFNIDDALQHTAFTPDEGFKDDLRGKLHQRYQRRKAAGASREREENSWVVFNPEPVSQSLLGRLTSALSGKLIPAFTMTFILLLVAVLGVAVMLPSISGYLTQGTETPSPTPAESTATPQPTASPTTEAAAPTPTEQIATEEFVGGIQSLFVGCSEVQVSGVVEVSAPYVRVGVALASNLMHSLGTMDVPVESDGSYQAVLTYTQQPAETRLIVSIGEWDGTQFLRPATMQGADCVWP